MLKETGLRNGVPRRLIRGHLLPSRCEFQDQASSTFVSLLPLHAPLTPSCSFTTPKILSDVPFRPPQSTLRPMIHKLTSSGTVFAALSSIGDVFTFSLPNPLEDISKDQRDRHVTVKPQLIWALRKRFDAVKVSTNRAYSLLVETR